MLGPVQVLVIGVPDAASARAVLAMLTALPGDGPVRALDAFEVTVGDAGDVDVDAAEAAPPPSLPLFGELVDDASGATSNDETWDLTNAVPPGSRAVVALLEHRWAAELRDSMVSAGAALRDETWLDADDRVTLEALLEAHSGT
jgi:Family of unknown function (DUF6325)